MTKKIPLAAAILGPALLSGCAMMQWAFPGGSADPVAAYKKAWIGRPVSDLNQHPRFIVMNVKKTADGDLEIRDYSRGYSATNCSAFSAPVGNSVGTGANCSSGQVDCHYLFYIRNGVIERQAWVGQLCSTDEAYLPERQVTQN